MRRSFVLGGLVISAALVLGACSGGGSGGSNSVDVGLNDFTITPSVVTASSGQVTFSVTNDGKETHEMVVLRTDEAPANLPMENGEVDEASSVGEVADLAVGDSKDLTLTLKPGNYVLICNLPGHYVSGMHTAFTVS
jgi:uncharacterized cupredoxin-like copper-binding protein